MRHGPARSPAPPAGQPCQGHQTGRPILRVIGTASGTVSAFGASLAGRNDIAIGLLTLTALALVGDLTAAMLRDRAFRKIASEGNAAPGVLRELNIREAIRSGQLSSEGAAIVLVGDLPVEQLQQSQRRQDQFPADPVAAPQRQ
jgi:hypothetical protein